MIKIFSRYRVVRPPYSNFKKVFSSVQKLNDNFTAFSSAIMLVYFFHSSFLFEELKFTKIIEFFFHKSYVESIVFIDHNL